MGVSVEQGGGHGRKVNAELNLVPFIDLLSVCITFLIATAVWVELASVPVDQALSSGEPAPPPVEAPPPLTVHVRHDGVWVGRFVAEGRTFGMARATYDWGGVEAAIASDRTRFPDEDQVVVVTDDGVAYREMIRALDVTRAHGYARSLLGGAPGIAVQR